MQVVNFPVPVTRFLAAAWRRRLGSQCPIEWCEVEVNRDGKVYFQRYEKGLPQGPRLSG